MKKRVKWLSLLLLSTAFSSFTSQPPHLLETTVYAVEQTSQTNEDGTLTFTGKKQLFLEEQDDLHRAITVHIQLQDKDEPTRKQPKKIAYKPAGWHNYKFAYNLQGDKSWLMTKGQLIAYQFSGLTDDKRNLVPMTNWLKTGNYKGSNDSNQNSLLYYESQLDDWLSLHPTYWLDYQVSAIYKDKELIPRQIQLQYVGLDENGQKVEIHLSSKETITDGISKVTLDNVSNNADIDYLTGKATEINLLEKAKEEEKKAKEVAKQVKTAEDAVQQLENNQVEENLTPAQEAINSVADDAKKAQLQNRLEAVHATIVQRQIEQEALERAEATVQQLEANQVEENLAPTQEAINQVTNDAKKAEFQNRLNAVSSAINQRKAEQERQNQLASAVQNSGGGYHRDAKGRWHRPNGQYASKAEIAAAGLPW